MNLAAWLDNLVLGIYGVIPKLGIQKNFEHSSSQLQEFL
jgi:hypothetical protein